MCVLFKSMLQANTILYLQFVNGFSGQQPIESFIYAMYDVDMTTIAVGFFMVFT
jgi:hypothetical protein